MCYISDRGGSASREILYDGQKRGNHIGINCAAAGTSGGLAALVTVVSASCAWQAFWAQARLIRFAAVVQIAPTSLESVTDMFEWKVDDSSFFIRDVTGEAEHHAIEDLQKEAWQFSDLDTVPAATLIATQHAGGIVLGAFESDKMIGFAYAFPAFEDGRTSMHSHMLGVKPEYRNFHAGYYLKLAQRERALEKGLDEITWTFDPLQSLNAHLNFTKLGVISKRYIVNFYGEATSSPLHTGFGTDRLWVRWMLKSDRVKQRISTNQPRHPAILKSDSAEADALIQSPLVLCEDSRPELSEFTQVLSGDRCSIEIPRDINDLKAREPELGPAWREATRAAFLAALDAGFVVEEFARVESPNGPRWFYLLRNSALSV